MTNSKPHTEPVSLRFFRRFALLTIACVYVLILIGGIVRSTGSGMGCPDWPKCFGSWIPPTEESQLPLNYKEIYGEKLKGEVLFNATKTWIEYLNRLFGVFTGLLIAGTFLASLPFRKGKAAILFYGSLVALLMVMFQGWLGSKVVSSELHPLMITLHMLLAILIVFVLLYVLARSYPIEETTAVNKQDSQRINGWLIAVLFVSTAQILLGTQVREAVDIVAAQLGEANRFRWVDELGATFYVHRSFSILVLVLNVYVAYLILNSYANSAIISRLTIYTMLVLGVEIVTGIVMAYWAIPAFAQPIHLTLSVLMIGLQFLIWLFVKRQQVVAHAMSIAQV
jgi:cytochrome c oxidase assembly protein subunit 15